jgi:hypothetical protein
MKYDVEMSPGVMMYIPSFVKIGSGIQKLLGENSQAHRQHGGNVAGRMSHRSYWEGNPGPQVIHTLQRGLSRLALTGICK